MKKILLLLLISVATYGQVPADATPLENIQITNNTTDNSATKVVVQSANNVFNTVLKTDLQDAFYFATASALPVTGITDKLYITRDNNKLYRFNGTIYQELTTDISGKEDISNKSSSYTVSSTTTYPNTKALVDGLTTKAIRNSIDFRGKDIEFFGDSYTSGTGATSTSNRWTSIVSRVLGANEINRGIAGTTLMKRAPIDYMASPNMVDNVVNIPSKTASKSMLVFAYGLNDMGQTATDYNTSNFKIDYQFVLNNALSKGWLPSQILIIPAYYIGSAGYTAYATLTGNAAPTEARHLSFIQATKEIAEINNTMYFDIYQDQKRNNTTLLDPDGIHPNDAGYAYIANDVLQYLGVDKIGTTLNTTYDLKAGFIPNNNGSVFYNSLIYDSGARIGIGTISPQSTFHVNSLANTVDQRFTNSVTGSTNLDGTTLTVDLNGDYVINNYENKGVITATNNIIRNYTNSIGQTILGGMSASNTSDKLQVIGSAIAQEWVSDNGSLGALYFGRNGLTNLYVIGSDNALGGSINDLAYFSYSGMHKFYQNVKITTLAGTGTRTVVADASGNLSATDATATSGTYTPTLTNVTNISSLVLSSATYTTIGNIVTVNVEGSIDPITANTATQFSITLPVNMSAVSQISLGSGAGGSSDYFPILVSKTSTSLITSYLKSGTDVNIQAFAVTFTYQK